MKIVLLIILLFSLISCGGGSSTASNIDDNNGRQNNLSITVENCISTNQVGLKKCDLLHDNRERFYYIYTPENLDSNLSIPVLFAFHGYGSSANRHMNYTNYMQIADENNFVVVYPQGATTPTLSAHWNVGGWTSKSTVKDIEFIETVINLIQDKIQIDQSIIYSSGMSNGGYMGYHLACNLSEKFAAIASVTGSMTTNTYDECDSRHPMPVLQIHGLLDYVVPYEGNSGSKSISDIIDYWINFNSCNPYPETFIKYDNYSLITYETYNSCINDVSVKLILHPTMGHTWPTIQSYNINASGEIWNFVSKYDLNGLIK